MIGRNAELVPDTAAAAPLGMESRWPCPPYTRIASFRGRSCYQANPAAVLVQLRILRLGLLQYRNVPIGDKFNHTAIGQGLERLRWLYGDYGYITFTAVPGLQLDKDRGTVVLTISIDEGSQFTFGRLFLAGQETRAGEADALRNGWAALSGKRYDSSLLRKWLMKNATFLPNDGQPLRHVEEHVDSSTHQVDFALTFP
jgi:outer membrane protein assembly factor BamA